MMAGQTINDRLLAARHSIAGQGLAKSVCKATTEEMIAPKKKHLDYLVHCTNEPNVSIPQLANLLVERTQNTNWVVVYKALITVHHLLAYGNERFTQYLASSNSTFQLSNFLDKSGVQGAAGARIGLYLKLVFSILANGTLGKEPADALGYDMSPFIRRYAKYLNEKALSYRTVAFDFCKVKRGKEEGSLRMMNADKLLKTLPVLQAQLDGLLEFDCTANDLTNGVINMCFMLIFRDLIRLFACYNDGIINLLEKYFDMNKKNCRDALDLYKKFLIRMDRVGEFLKVAENVGIDKGDIPDLTKAPSSLLEALEAHLAALEGRRLDATPTALSTQKNVASVMGAMASTSSAFGDASERHANGSIMIDDALKKQALAEEEAAINQYKNKVQSPTNSAANNPFLSSSSTQNNGGNTSNIVDLFSAPAPTDNGTKASDDLLSLGNPFADMFSAAPTGPGGAWGAPTAGTVAGSGPASFLSDDAFTNVFDQPDGNDRAAPNPFMGMGAPNLPPSRPPPPAQQPAGPRSAFDELEDAMRVSLGGSPSRQPITSQPQPQSAYGVFGSPARQSAGPQPAQQPGKVLTGDLDSSLASLANNLTINKTGQAQMPMNWSSPKAQAKGNWSPQPMQATTGAGYRPMGSGMTLAPMPHTMPHNYHTPHYFMQQPGMVMGMQSQMVQPMGAMRPPIPPQPQLNNQFS